MFEPNHGGGRRSGTVQGGNVPNGGKKGESFLRKGGRCRKGQEGNDLGENRRSPIVEGKKSNTSSFPGRGRLHDLERSIEEKGATVAKGKGYARRNIVHYGGGGFNTPRKRNEISQEEKYRDKWEKVPSLKEGLKLGT